jgi:DNA repair exonuclease SbcCD ATPase subunit
MRITRLTIRDFRRYREFDVPLAPGLTIIHGPNEAGKTTIQRALELVLTKKVTTNAAELEALRSWDAPEDARPVISIEFETDDDEGRTQTGFVEKQFRGAKGTVRLDVDGQTITDPTLADQALAELTGIPTEAFFRSTASIRHHELADLDRDEAALRDRLQASISGADRGTSRAKRILERAL